MRSALLIVLGLVIGIVGTVFAMNALHDREPYSHTLMTTMAHHAGVLSAAVKAQKCDAAQTQHHLTRLLETQADIDESFPGVDQPFKDEAAKLREKTLAALQAAPGDCAALAAAIKPIGETCQSCHQQYR
ncbi:Cytochrome c556 [Dyella jiangningensis]|uniref:cytochrome c n=1 Tax=Dyella sp. AtDHG13 TaxID=1938897 RepID=UPI00088DFFDD|nr:cytochrome c [Dyella sp. AtDHG13]PXV58571.1 cytochrome c556 [Dyella sp. AtDHG13]SDL15040.1 Cytochrome c556 [Dyella jiangningensis]